MAETQSKLKATLTGRLETPIIISKPFIKQKGCWIKIVRDPYDETYPLSLDVGKLVKGGSKAPVLLRGYRGYIKISCVGYNKDKLLSTLNLFLMKQFLGKLSSEGFGRVAWLDCELTTFQANNTSNKKKFKIRKGLGINYPKELQRLLIALMLHDFVDTDFHPSKIYK
ncbi:MAG: hypothetical protein ACTSO7_17650, partial [Candidatus Heimdallarchaeota archaeon]